MAAYIDTATASVAAGALVRIRNVVAILSLVGLAGGIGVLAGYLRWHRITSRPFFERELAVLSQASEIAKGSTIVAGDSVIERQRVDDLCGPTLNVGLGYAETRDLIPSLIKVLNIVRPRTVVLEIGSNDIANGASVDELASRYERLIAAAAGTRIIIVGIPGFGDANKRLAELAAEKQLMFIPAIEREGNTVDGLHLNAIGAITWQSRVRVACQAN